jgi:phage shock protein A
VAVKCFLNDVPRQQARYEAVSAHLDAVALDALVDFDYQAEGIRVGGEVYPLLKMEWVDGTVLNRFVEEHLDAPDVLARLAETWAGLMANLEKSDLAHGDLQHGNVLVQKQDDDLRLRLVDYDTMYVPALEGGRSAEVGHRNYQHPDRTDADFGPFLDRFPALAVYTALRACAVRPALWDRHDTGENLLFRDGDFYEPQQSALFDELTSMKPVADLVEALRTACYVEPRDVPPLADVRDGRLEPADVSVRRARRQRGRSADERDALARYFLPGIVGLAAGAGAMGAAGLPLLGGGLATGGVVGAAAWAARRYRRLSLTRRRQRLEQEEARFAEAIRGLRREVDSLKEKRADLRTSIDERRAERLDEVQDEALRDHLKHHFIGEVREVDGIIHKHVVRLKLANIRTAYEATPEAVAGVRRISDEARARINMWRAALVRKYEDEVPDALSPAEERRLRRYIDHRIEDLDDQIARTKEKIEVQRTERERVRDRLDEMPEWSPGRYLRYLLRLEAFPSSAEAQPPRPPSPPNGESQFEASPEPVPEPAPADQSWWERGRDE